MVRWRSERRRTASVPLFLNLLLLLLLPPLSGGAAHAAVEASRLADGGADGTPVGEAQVDAPIEFRVDADGLGFAGVLSRDGVRVAFQSRATAAGAESRILSADGEVLSEVLVDLGAGTFVYRVGGVSLADEPGAEEEARAMKALARADAGLAAERLWSSVASLGYPKDSRAMFALAANLTAYSAVPKEYFPVEGKGACMGCCGPSCWGCMGCWTRACYAHDECVAKYGYLSSRCFPVLYLAALSAWCCQGVDVGPLC